MMPSKYGKNTNGLLFKKQCKYIGSLAVTLLNGEERQRFVNEKLIEMKDIAKGISVVIMITDEGVKVLKDDESAVKMAHGITRIAFSTCQPERRLFAYVAKSIAVDRKVIIQAHMFKTKKNSHSQQLSLNLSKAFKVSYARDTTRRRDRVKLFESEAEEKKSISQIQNRGKRWAKVEQAHGHEYSGHAINAKGRHESSDINKTRKTSQEQNNSGQRLSSGTNEVDSSQLGKRENIKEDTTMANPSPAEEIGPVEAEVKSSAPENSNNTPRKRRVSKGRKISEDKRKISQEKNINNSNEVLNLVSGITIDENSRYNIITPTAKFSSVNEYENLSGYENVVMTKDGYQIVDEVFQKEDVIFVDADNNELYDADNNELDVSRTRMDISRFTMTEDEILKDSEWFQPGFSREIAETVLQNRSIGSFFIRDSISHPGYYVMSIKVPMHLKANGVGHFLIERIENNFKIKGFTLTFPTLTDLVAHYGSVSEDIPCQLRLANDNPLFMRRLHIDQPDAPKDNEQNDGDNVAYVSDEDEYDDPDYENFSCNDEIMKELASVGRESPIRS